MRVIIDTNVLRSDELRGFLEMSRTSVAVLPDYVLMETFKSGDLGHLRDAFEILSLFPDQVVALKGTEHVSKLTGSASAIAQGMINLDETVAFRSFCRALRIAHLHPGLETQIRTRQAWAQEHMAVMDAGFADFGPAMDEFRAPFTPGELAQIARDHVTPLIREKFFGLASSLAYAALDKRPDVPRPEDAVRSDHFVFRNALGYSIYMLSRVMRGVMRRGAAKVRNDTIDVLLATYGTYFDGVMSEDTLTNATFQDLRGLLQAYGVTVGGDYLHDTMRDVLDFQAAREIGEQ